MSKTAGSSKVFDILRRSLVKNVDVHTLQFEKKRKIPGFGHESQSF